MTLEELEAGAGTVYLFHYTDEIRAAGILEERLFVTGGNAVFGFGVYATEIPPLDSSTLDDVIVRCFGGDAIPPEVQHAIVLRRSHGDREFLQTSEPYQWILPTAKLGFVDLSELYVGAVLWDGETWRIYDSQ